MPIQSYRELRVWRQAVRLALRCYRVSARFPSDERFGLTSQLRRASVSVAANIAEGHGRSSRRDYLRYVSIARGSLKEMETHLIIARGLGYLERPALRQLLEETDHVGRMLTVLRHRLESS